MAMVSVIVPMRNERRGIESCLSALQAQDYPAEHLEFVIADGDSTDGSRKIVDGLATRDPRIRIVASPGGRTPDSLNRAILASRGEVIVRVDGHSTPPRGHISRCVSLLYRTAAWCVGGRMLKVGTSAFGRAAAIAATSRFGVGDSAFHFKTSAGPVESVYLGAWPRWVFDRVGLFDPELLRDQDDELSFRIRHAGGVIWFDPSISVEYHPRETWRRLFDQYRQYGKFKVRVIQKHPGAARWRHLVPAAFVTGLAVGLLTPFNPEYALTAGAIAFAYALANLTVAARAARVTGDVHVIDISRAFLAMHLGYGVGFWQGLVVFLPRWFVDRRGAPPPNLSSTSLIDHESHR